MRILRDKSAFRIAALAIGATMLLGSAQPGRAQCQGEDGGSSLVTGVRGGDTLILEDGRAVRPAGILLPRRSFDGALAREAREQAEKALADLVQGQVVSLQLDGRTRDRYGRLLAHIFVASTGERVWVQQKLLAAGLARAFSSKDNRLYIGELLAAERGARETGQGHWRSGYFSVKPASSEEMLTGLNQSFEIVEGRIESVAEVKGRIYLNFGRNWRRDFTIVIPGDVTRLFAPEADPLTRLQGRAVRVRGWIEHFNGPSISITHPEQIELLSHGTAARH